MINIRILGTPLCHRYQRMLISAQEAAVELGLEIQLEEINDTERLAQSNPLDLPKMVIDDVVIATRNPPKVKTVKQYIIQNVSLHQQK